MGGFRPVLVTENTYHASYLVTMWLATFGVESSRASIVIRDERPRSEVRRAATQFHARNCGRRELVSSDWSETALFYRGFSETERAMVQKFGVPEHAASGSVETTFIGRNLNDPSIKDWLASQCSTPVKPFFFVFLDRLLAPWWIELADSRIINAHSAILPVARGLHAIEQIAATEDPVRFLAAAGATVHYVDSGIDTGSIIACERINDPMQFDSIWECKGHLFIMAFDLLINAASRVFRKPSIIPVGVSPAIDNLNPDFKRSEFTLERQKQAEAGYLAMKSAARQS